MSGLYGTRLANPMIYSWVNYVALLIFMMLPFLIAHRLKGALVYYKYMP